MYSAPPRTEADVMSAALRLHGYPARLHGDGGTTFFAVPLDPETPADDVFLHAHFLIASGERADRPVTEHDEPWSAALYEGGREYVDVIYAGKPGLSIEKDAEACVLAVVEHAARTRAGHVHIPVPGNAQRLVDAIQAAGANAWYDHEEGVVFAHPAGVPQDRALLGEHISLQLLTDSTGWPGGFRAVAWVPDGGVDFHETAQVFLFCGVPDQKEVDRGAQAVAEWFSRPSPGAV
ncbi:hypothetical protein [Streptomyces sp. NBC_01264]|uniref:hypothetical protein n=1 Tax=Streptomyces sp. NBC_01264 TaxID=2903804 RepID=UPI00224D39CE|nr:hypothetical protein [Streptomyces sp. NBC_01264]MCX4784125.1 hypothetical protein [Streptomyces sp. NBC_01264]